MKPSKRHFNQSGFTLLEVMIAVIIMGIVILVLSETSASTVSVIERVRDKTFAVWVAENKMTQLRLSDSFPAAREFKETVDMADREWLLVTKVKTTANIDINRVEIEVSVVSDTGDDQSPVHRLTGFVGRF